MGFISDSISATTISANTLYITSVGSGTPQISLGLDSNFQVVTGSSDNNTYTTGTTISGNVVEFNRTDTQNAYDVNLSGITYTNIITSPTQIATNVDTANDYLGITGSAVLTDEASNYGGIWNNGSNQGTGFNPWVIIAQPNTGVFIGNPASDGMGTAGIGTTAFGLFCNSTPNSVNASRPFTSPLEVGDVFSFYWAVNFDGAPNGNKGFDLKAGGNLIFNADIAASALISSNLPLPYNVIDSGYGTTPMLVTLTRTTNTQYTITITSRSGGPTYSAPINSSLGIDEVNFYNVEQPDGLGQRNLYFNKLELKKLGLNKLSVDELKIALNVSTGLYSAGTGTDSTVRINTLNFANGNCSIVAGGSCNTSSGYSSTVSGGFRNTSSGRYSTISGGYRNTSSCYYSTVSGGFCNTASNNNSTVSGGRNNTSSGYISNVSGGFFNTSSGIYSTVSGGYQNKAKVDRSTIGGGQNNVAGLVGTISGYYNQTYLGSTLNGIFTNISPTSNLVGTGAGATFNFGFTLGVFDFVTINNIGEGYQNGDQLLFDGTLFGGAPITDNVTLNVNAINLGVYSTIGGGDNNTSIGQNSTIGGGRQNTTINNFSTISGGRCNTSSCYYSTVSGGYFNVASCDSSTVSGGEYNTSSGRYTTIGGGSGNFAENRGDSLLGGGANQTATIPVAVPFLLPAEGHRTIGGGARNLAQGNFSSILGGILNTVASVYSFIGGGRENTIDCITTSGGGSVFGSTIGGGSCNTISSYSAYSNSYGNTIAGGTCNTMISSFCNGQTIGGGQSNITSSDFATVSGGRCNTASCYYSTVSGGRCNTASGYCSNVGGGNKNTTIGDLSSISGGDNNKSNGFCSFIGNGKQNITLKCYSIVVGGQDNFVNGELSSIVGGKCNTVISDIYDSIGGGQFNRIETCSGLIVPNNIVGGSNNTVSGCYVYGALIGGGKSNTISGSYSGSLSIIGGGCENKIFTEGNNGIHVIAGGGSNYISGNTTVFGVIGGGNCNTVLSKHSTISGGYKNTTSGYCSGILGGCDNKVINDCSFIIGNGITSTVANTTHMNCLNLKDIPTFVGSVPPGTPLGTVYKDGSCNLKIV